MGLDKDPVLQGVRSRMVLGHLLFMLALSVEMGSSQTDALQFDCAATASAAFSTPCDLAGPGLSAPAAALTPASQPSPWDDEIEIPDEPEDEEPDEPGEALNSKAPTRGHFATFRSCGLFKVVATPRTFRAAPAPHTGGPSPTPTTLCRLLF